MKNFNKYKFPFDWNVSTAEISTKSSPSVKQMINTLPTQMLINFETKTNGETKNKAGQYNNRKKR